MAQPFAAIGHALPASDRDVASRRRFERLSLLVYFAYLTIYVIEGPLRAGLSIIGLPNLLYVRDLIAVSGIVLAYIVPMLRRERLAPGLFLMSWVLAVHLCISILMDGEVFQRLFGMKIFIPLLYSVALYPLILAHFALFLRGMLVFFVISVAGVLINYAVGTMPWEGLNYDTAFGSVATTKQWWMSKGLRRLPGFARASFDAAMIIGITGITLIATARQRWLRLCISAIGMAAILLTTMKGMVAAYVVASIWLVLGNRSQTSFKVGRAIAIVLLLLTCLVPAIFMFVSVPERPPEIPMLLRSLWDRFSWMWPGGFALVPDLYGGLMGGGLGSIGTPLVFTGTRYRATAADSIFVYYYVSFGVLGILYLAFPLLGVLRAKAQPALEGFVWIGLLIVAYAYGLSINMVEQVFFAHMLGLLYGAAFASIAKPQGQP